MVFATNKFHQSINIFTGQSFTHIDEFIFTSQFFTIIVLLFSFDQSLFILLLS
ncbi:MAG: hypothetical protein WCG25_01765 [bacterium]